MKYRLFWEKHRPSDINNVVLLPRIKKAVEHGVTQNLLMYGGPGCGKTTLSRIIAKLYPSYSINASKQSSVEMLRNQIDKFCSTVDMMFDSKPVGELLEETGFDIDLERHNPEDIKIVFLDEFDGVSKAFQEGLRGFIEEYEGHVRFIATCNNVNKISEALQSRFLKLNFNSQNVDEEKFIKTELAKSIMKDILPIEELTISKDDLIRIINKNFPDLRAVVQEIQYLKETGELNIFDTSNVDIKLQNQLFNMVVCVGDPMSVFDYVNDNFGADRVDTVVKLLGKPFIHWCLLNKKDWLVKFPDMTKKVTEYGHMLPTTLDPLVLGVSLIYELQRI